MKKILTSFLFLICACGTPCYAAQKPAPKQSIKPQVKSRPKGTAKRTVSNARKPPVRISKTNAPRRPIQPSSYQKNSQIKKGNIPPKPLSGGVIVLDAGHGGFDYGASTHSCHEKFLCLSTALICKRYLSQMGYRVILTRTRDVFIPLARRAKIANQTKAKLFLSIHYNAAKNSQAHGIEVYYYGKGDQLRQGKSKKLAQSVLSRLLVRTGAVSRGVKTGNFLVIRETSMPSILIEGGFITNPKERARLSESKYRDKVARAIAEGVDRYLKAH